MTITTLNLISKQTVGAAGAASVTFSNIPQTYTDLKILVSARHSTAEVSNDIVVSFNGSTSNFTARRLYGSGSATGGDTNARSMGTTVGASATASTFANNEIYIPNYTSSNYKSYSTDQVGENNDTLAYAILVAGLWSDVAAITSITLTAGTGSFVQYSTFTLYGVSSNTTTQNATVPYATGGNIIATDGSYWYHQFLYSGTFTPLKGITCDYLVVAGGGAGGSGSGVQVPAGGGGGGGMRCTVTGTGGSGSLETALSLALNTNYTVTVGAGGAAAISPVNGSNSVFSTITSLGGGGGGSVYITPTRGQDGGSGGGGAGANATALVKGSGNAAQGFDGGAGIDTGNEGGGGGGGASAVGATAATNAGNGGAGRATSISGSSVTYAGGGGGSTRFGGSAGTGGAGGGATGRTTAGTGASGTTNTGGGGAGGIAAANNGGNGGSGIVIVRYAV